jgi:hypothetical protein
MVIMRSSSWWAVGGVSWFLSLCACVLAGVLVAGCEDGGSDDDADSPNPDGEEVNLGIPDRWWDPGHEDVGWCGETCIQMALGYYGREISQEEINKAAGSPSDITEDNMDTALTNLGVPYLPWDINNHDVDQFIEWIKDELRRGRPVICGTKIYPDEHPDWYVDHFVLAVGFDSTGLLLNTQNDCDGQITVSYSQLTSRRPGYSFENDQHLYFGRSILGP